MQGYWGGGGVQNRHLKAEGEGAKFQCTDSVGDKNISHEFRGEGFLVPAIFVFAPPPAVNNVRSLILKFSEVMTNSKDEPEPLALKCNIKH